MITFCEANQIKYQIKMKLANYAWYESILIVPSSNGYDIQVSVNKMNSFVRKIVPKKVNAVNIKLQY